MCGGGGGGGSPKGGGGPEATPADINDTEPIGACFRITIRKQHNTMCTYIIV